jgi:hypothetical protein
MTNDSSVKGRNRCQVAYCFAGVQVKHHFAFGCRPGLKTAILCKNSLRIITVHHGHHRLIDHGHKKGCYHKLAVLSAMMSQVNGSPVTEKNMRDYAAE